MRYKLQFEYDGTHFHGWQRQTNVRTVEGEVEKAFTRLYQQPIDIIGQGRTDSGVHAKFQVAHVDLPDNLEIRQILHAMKGLLPADVALISAEKSSDNFHSRFDAISRSYSYQITTKPSAIFRNFEWYCYLKPNHEVLKKCSEQILGTHDFVNFCIPPELEMQTTICSISESKWIFDTNDLFKYKITGNRFLRHMVRRLVGAMIYTASGKLTISQFSQLLSADITKQKAYTAPAKGLFLEFVNY